MFNRRHAVEEPPKTPRARRGRSRLAVFAVQTLVCTACVCGFLYCFNIYVRESGVFNVKAITVTGAGFLRVEDIIAQSGVTNEHSLVTLSSDEVRQRVLALPHVSECTVERVFPDRLEIAIKERVALATLLVNNRLFELDRDAIVLRELGAEEPHTGPFVTVESGLDYVEVGRQISQESLKNALEVWDAFKGTQMARDVTVSEISAGQGNRIGMTCDELNCEIRWARAGVEKQAWKLDVFWQSEKGRLPFREYIDLRFGNDVACR